MSFGVKDVANKKRKKNEKKPEIIKMDGHISARVSFFRMLVSNDWLTRSGRQFVKELERLEARRFALSL